MNFSSLINNSASNTVRECMGGRRVSAELTMLVEAYSRGRVYSYKYDHPWKYPRDKQGKPLGAMPQWIWRAQRSGLQTYGGKTKEQGDPKPVVLVFGRKGGRKKDAKTGRNKLICGINLNLLDATEKKMLQMALPNIIAVKGTSNRYREAKKAMATVIATNRRVFSGYSPEDAVNALIRSYRTWDQDNAHQLDMYTLPSHDEQEQIEIKKQKKAEIAAQKAQKRNSKKSQSKQDLTKAARHVGGLEEPPTPTPEEPQIPKPEEPTPKAAETDKAAAIQQIEPDVLDALADLDVEPPVDKKKEEAERVEKAARALRRKGLGPHPIGDSRLNGLNAVIEAYVLENIPAINWRTKKEYVKWHGLDTFFKPHPDTGRPVIESAKGSRFMAIYDIIDDKLVVDIANSRPEMLCETGWDYDHTLCISLENGELDVFYEHPRGKKALQTLMDGDFGRFVNALI